MATITKLDQLLSAGALIENDTAIRPVLWTTEAGDVIEFDVIVKTEMSAADYEFIYLGFGDTSNDPSYLARRVHRMARFGGGEVIPLEQAVQFKPDLLRAICEAIGAVEKPIPKPSSRQTSSGSNSSPPASAAKPSVKPSTT